jgi:16S rRNA (cytosine967-C5)-methyltransferase
MDTRYIAVRALKRIFNGAERPKEVLDDLGAGLGERERPFLMELVYGVLRYRDYLDWLLSGFIKRPSGLSPDTINNLRAAVYQLCFMRVPEWAAVDEAVTIEKRPGGKAPLVNAVLRGYLRGRSGEAMPLPGDTAKKISISTSHPEWLVRRWISRLGPEEAEMLAKKNNEVPALTLRVDTGREEALKLLEENGIDAVPTMYSPSGIIMAGRRKKEYESAERCTGEAPDEAAHAEYRRVTPGQIPLEKASFVVQDESAQLVALLLDPRPGEKVLDACAAPGGKTTHIARLMKDEGEVVALDIDEGRSRKIGENIARLGIRSARAVIGDIRKCGPDADFDRVLLDAPCSSIGVIRRNPDVKYRHTPADLARFGALQLELLESASRHIKKGGIMVYSVCSTEPEEGDEVVRAFLHSHADFSIIEGAYDFPGQFAYNDREGHTLYRTWPHKAGGQYFDGYGMDGFFAARLVKDKK